MSDSGKASRLTVALWKTIAASTAAPTTSGARRRHSSGAAISAPESAAAGRSPAGATDASSTSAPIRTAAAISRSSAGPARARSDGSESRRPAAGARPWWSSETARGSERCSPLPTGSSARAIAGDAHALLLGGVARVALAIAREPLRLAHQVALEQRLAAHPAPDQQRQRDRHERQHGVTRRVDRRIGRRARRGERHDADRGGGEAGPALEMATGGVERDDDRDQRNHRITDEEAAQQRLGDQRDRDRRERQQRERAPPRERQRRCHDRNGADPPAAVPARPGEHLE